MKLCLLIFLFVFAISSWAQDKKDEAQINEIEDLFDEDAEQEERQVRQQFREKKEKRKTRKIKKLSDLKKLETFSDIAVIQKRFLPKTGRFEFFAGGGTNLNDAFFVGNGLSFRLGYYFRERWGIEGVYNLFSNDNRDVTNELLKAGVQTNGQVSTNSFYGIDLKWTPIYGKYGYFNEKIIPFDLYFSAGIGITDPKIGTADVTVNSVAIDRDAKPLTFRFGTGQIFALTKWMAFRWDLSWHWFSVTSPLDGQDSFHNNLFLNVGVSFFFPEAKYR